MLDVPATAQHETYRYLRDRILDAELPAEALINPAEIAEHLGISRMPVREALRQLDAEGLVSMRPNRRAVVTRLSVAEVEDLFEMRAHSCSNVRQRAKSGRPLRWQSVGRNDHATFAPVRPARCVVTLGNLRTILSQEIISSTVIVARFTRSQR